MTTKEFFISREKGGEQAFLVQFCVARADYENDFEEALEEFSALAVSAGANIVGVMTGNLKKVMPKYFMGEGKAEEIAALIKVEKADVILINHMLTPAQARNLEALCECRVVDRSELILDIFSLRARTHEGQLQVELAQLTHASSRLVRGWSHLESQKGGIGMRGPGETQLETDRRLVQDRISKIKSRLKKVEMQRDQNRRARDKSNLLQIALVGYTNAGKSTLFNQLTQSEVFVADQLFATLDPTLRRIIFPQLGELVIADTVGFIQHLPHELIAAFKATLEETRQADLLLHVIDVHSDQSVRMTQDVNAVLTEIGAGHIPQLQVMNKIDLLGERHARIDYNEHKLPKRVWISAAKKIGLDLLEQAITELLSKRLTKHEVILNTNQGKLRAKLYELGVVQSEKTDDAGNHLLSLEIQQADFERFFNNSIS